MKKTIILTGLLLICSLISDVFVQSSAKGSVTQRSQAAIALESKPKFDFKPKQELIDSALLKTISLPLDVNYVEKVDIKILYRNVKGTVYHAEESQCDNTPLITADNSLIDTAHVNDLRWVALSRDLLNRKFTDPYGRKHVWAGKIKLGDTIWVDYDNKALWKLTHERQNPKDTVAVKRNDARYEKLKTKYEQIRGYWIVHDVMGTQYIKRTRDGRLIPDKDGKPQTVYIHTAIDFLQHPELGMMDVWDRHIIIANRKVTKITLPVVAMN